MPVLVKSTAIASIVLLLAACGGGGSGGDSAMSDTEPPSGSTPGTDVSFPAELSRTEFAATLREYAGGEAPRLDDAASDSRIATIVGAADSWMSYTGPRDTAPETFTTQVCDTNGCGSVTAESFAPDLYSTQEYTHVMAKNGVHVQLSWYTSAHQDAMGEWLFEGRSFAGLLEHGMFYANEIVFGGETTINVDAIGEATGAAPAAGTATWSGVVTGFDADGWVYGDATLTMDFQDVTVDAAFGELVGLSADAPRYNVAAWTDLPVVDGGFQSDEATRSIQGAFYGSAGDEAGGVFFDRGEGVGGAFGAVRAR